MADKKIKNEDRMTGEEKLITRISTSIALHIKTILILCVVIFVALIAIVVVSGVSSANREKNLIAVSDFEDKVPVVIASGDGVDELITGLQGCIKDKSYASQKAQYLIGVIYHSLQRNDEAYDAFIKSYDMNKGIYLANLALMNAAVCKDDAGDYDKALEHYRTVVDRDDVGMSSRALFNIGRIFYNRGDAASAKNSFERLIEKYPSSELSKIARNLIDQM